MRIVRDFSAADGFRRDAHVDMIRREAQREREVAAHARTDACRLDGRPSAELAGRGSGGHRSHRAMKAGGGGRKGFFCSGCPARSSPGASGSAARATQLMVR
jgi:hypothetical protein